MVGSAHRQPQLLQADVGRDLGTAPVPELGEERRLVMATELSVPGGQVDGMGSARDATRNSGARLDAIVGGK